MSHACEPRVTGRHAGWRSRTTRRSLLPSRGALVKRKRLPESLPSTRLRARARRAPSALLLNSSERGASCDVDTQHSIIIEL
eukprot:6492306-Amphidinium_carterae.1